MDAILRKGRGEADLIGILHAAWSAYVQKGHLDDFRAVGDAVRQLRPYMRVAGIKKWFDQHAPAGLTPSLAVQAERISEHWEVVEKLGVERVASRRNALRVIAQACTTTTKSGSDRSKLGGLFGNETDDVE